MITINEKRLFVLIVKIPLEHFKRSIGRNSFEIYTDLDLRGRQKGLEISKQKYDVTGGPKAVPGFIVLIRHGNTYSSVHVPDHGEHKDRYAIILGIYNKLLIADHKMVRRMRDFAKRIIIK